MAHRTSLTVLQLNDSHAYCDLHQELFWQGGQAVYRPAGGYARIATIVRRIRAANQGRTLFCDCGDTLHGTYPAQKTQGEALIPILNTTGDDALQPGRYYPTAFVTEQGVAKKYGRNRQQHTERSIEALRAYLARHRPLHAELRGTFVAV